MGHFRLAVFIVAALVVTVVAIADQKAGPKSSKLRYLLYQDFNWHDVTGEGDYVFGDGGYPKMEKSGYLKMDGSRGRIQCYRPLSRKIVDGRGAVEVGLRVVLGRHYSISLYDSRDAVVVDCRIDEDGRVRFAAKDGVKGSGKSLTFWNGTESYTDVEKIHHKIGIQSDEHIFRFGNFDFESGSFNFTIGKFDVEDSVTMDGCLLSDARDIARLELKTHTIRVGNIIHLRHYKEFLNSEVVGNETFRYYWKSIPDQPQGMPMQNIREFKYRPVGNEWLETKTKYGFIETLFPVTLKGTLEFDIKTPNVHDESAVILGEYDSATAQGGLIQIGIAFEKFYYGNLDNPPMAVEDEIYNVRISWDGSKQSYRVWIDGVPQKKERSYDIPIPYPGLRKGIDFVCLHCGSATWSAKDANSVVTYWRRFRVTASEER